MAPRIRKITKKTPSADIIEIDDDVAEMEKTTKSIEEHIGGIEPHEIVPPSEMQQRVDEFLATFKKPEAQPVIAPEAVKVRKERKKKKESQDAVVNVRPVAPVSVEEGEVWAEVRYAIDAQRVYTLGAKRKLREGETMESAHTALYKQVLNSILTLV